MSVDPHQCRDNVIRYRRLANMTTDPRLAQQLRDRADDYARQTLARKQGAPGQEKV